MVSKGLARGAFIHVRLNDRPPSSSPSTQGFPAPVEEASLTDSLVNAGEKFAKGFGGGLAKGKVPKSPLGFAKDLFEKVGMEFIADFSNAANAEKFGKECQVAFIESWADTMANLMDDPRHEYRLNLQAFVTNQRKPDIRALEAQRATLPRNHIYGAWQVGQFKLAGLFAAYDMVKRMRDFDPTAVEWRRAYPTYDGRKRALIREALSATAPGEPRSPRR
jgi:hypothetical protein